MRDLTLITLMAGLLGGLVGSVDAQTLTFVPVATASLEADNEENGQIAVRFDVSGLKLGPAEEISIAVIEWRIDGVVLADDEPFEVIVYEVASGWTDVVSESETLELAEQETDSSPVTNLSFEANKGFFVRLNITGLVRNWYDGGANHGVSLVVRGVEEETVNDAVGDVLLRIKIGQDWLLEN